MAKLNENEFKKIIKEEPKKIYYIYGEEKYLIKHYTSKLQEKIAGKKPSDFSCHIFENGEDLEQISIAINTISFMGERTYVEIHDFDFNKLTDNEFDVWLNLIENLTDSVTVVISQLTIKVDGSKSKTKKTITAIEKNGVVANIEKRGDMALEKQLVSWATKQGVKLSAIDASRIVSYCGTDLYMLRNELDKLCAYVDGTEITREVIDKLVVKNTEARIFDLAKLVITGSTDKAYTLLSDLFYNREEPVTIVSILSLTYVDMYRVRVYVESGKRCEDVACDFDYKRKEFRLKNAQRQASTMTTQEIRECIDLLVEADKMLKSARVDKEILVQELITKLMLVRNKR